MPHRHATANLARHDPPPNHRAWVNYENEDGGKTWHLPASGVPSVTADWNLSGQIVRRMPVEVSDQ
jgi:hypothetical protein